VPPVPATDLTDDVIDVIVTTLGLENRTEPFVATTPLLDHIPELDSMAIVELVVALEDRFGITIDEDEISGDVFETVATLASFVTEQHG
jgi:acyl carrier protein